MRNIRFARSIATLSFAAVILICGCEPSAPPPKLGVQNWRPTSVGGPLEVRPLPPAAQMLDDYRKWMGETTGPVARVYQTTLVGSSNQLNFKVDVLRGETPMGRPQHTYVTFDYRNSSNGTYRFVWDRLGRHNADFMKLGEAPKRVWVTFNWRASEPAMPIVEIEGFEGMEASGVLIASPGGDLK